MLIVFLGIFVMFLLLGFLCFYVGNKIWLMSKRENMKYDIEEKIEKATSEEYLKRIKCNQEEK